MNNKNKNPLLPISVIIPVYNAESFLAESIESVLNQSFSDFELLIMDDGSSDRSEEIIKSYDDKRIRYFPCKHDFIATRNKGKKLAQGKYIAQLDHDDIMMPDRLQIQYDFMEAHPDIAACGGYIECFGKYSRILQLPLEQNELLPLTITFVPIHNSSGFIRREFLIKHKIRHRRGYSFAEDFKFWTDIIKIGKLANIPEVLIRHRTSDQQTSIKYRKESIEASNRIQLDMIDYFLTLINKDDSYGKAVFHQLMPAIIKMSEADFFSGPVLFNFMHEVITGLIKNGTIKLS